jgi:hypothetical protein
MDTLCKDVKHRTWEIAKTACLLRRNSPNLNITVASLVSMLGFATHYQLGIR